MKANKPLLPSLKEKKRYMVFEIISEKKIPEKKIYKKILDSFEKLFGSIGLGRAGIVVLKENFNKDLKRGMIRVNHKFVDQVRFSLSIIKKIDNIKVIINCIGVSGMIKKAKSRYL
ncbi:hypothetical protein GF327_01145 [Candidatus Woesearchaeota archaeon]|nr:hypothetical protein [Candidatus Woesearchaeota archaeon]